MTYRLRLARTNALKIKVSTRIPAQLQGGTAIDITRLNGTYTFDWNLSGLGESLAVADASEAVTFLPIWNEFTDVYTVISLTNLKADIVASFDEVYASESITLTAGAGLTGGGDLSANRSFAVGAGSGITVNADDVALDTASTRNTDHTSVTLSAGAGLTGGGDISANRSFAVGAGSGITVNADDVALDTSSTRNTDHTAVTLSAGAGLTGGGDITTNRSFAVGAGTGIVVNADDVALAAIADDRLLANISGGSAAPSANTLTAILDSILGTTQGAIVTRNSSGWTKLDPGTSGHFLKSQGAAADLIYDAIPGGGDVLGANNGSEFADKAATRSNLGVVVHNRVINGRFQVDQRYAGVSTVIADAAYGPDRWKMLGEDSLGKLKGRDTTVGGGRFNGVVTCVTANNKYGVIQYIKGENCRDLRGQTVTLSAHLSVSNARLGNIKMGIIEWTSTEDTLTSDPISSWGADGVTPTLAANFAFINTPANLSVTTTPTTYTVSVTLGTTFNNLAVIIWNDDKAFTANDEFYVTDVWLSRDAAGAPFQWRPGSQELFLCMEYFQRGGAESIYCSNVTSGSTYFYSVKLSPPMRAAPTSIVTTNGGGDPPGFPITASSTTAATTTGFQTFRTADATVSAGYFSDSWTAVAEL